MIALIHLFYKLESVDENKDTPVITDIHDLTKTPEPILIDTPVLPTTGVISPEKRLQYLRRACDQ